MAAEEYNKSSRYSDNRGERSNNNRSGYRRDNNSRGGPRPNFGSNRPNGREVFEKKLFEELSNIRKELQEIKTTSNCKCESEKEN